MAHRSETKGHWGWTARQARALVWLLPMLAVASWLVWEAARPRSGAPEVAQQDSIVVVDPASKKAALPHPDSPPAKEPELFRFDPNTIEYHNLTRLGFTRGEALGIVKFRARGKVFEIAEDFAACHQVSESMWERLRPYIVIGEKYRLQPFAPRTTAKATPDTLSSVQNATETLQLIDLNRADSAQLLAIVGIGEGTLGPIIDYRERLGGFARLGQLAEVRGVRESNYERIVTQIFVDTLAIRKIDVNFAPAREFTRHPYIRPEALRKLLKNRQLKGGWSSTGELEKEHIFTPDEFARLRPYLSFGTIERQPTTE